MERPRFSLRARLRLDRTRASRLDLALWLALATALPACGPGSRATAPPDPPLTEAYALMDQGENAKAILLLENELRNGSATDEARLMLASAYLGAAGVDLYALYDTFQDVLFARPLEESLLSPTPAEEAAPPPPAGTDDDLSPKDAPLRELIGRLDRSLSLLRRILVFLSRFPQIPHEKWGLLHRALDELHQVGAPSKDLLLYRVFIRVVILKTFLEEGLIGDPSVGTRAWACGIRLSRLEEDLGWMAREMDLALSDFQSVYPRRASSLQKVHAAVSALEANLEARDGPARLPGEGVARLTLEERLQEALRCER